MTDYPLKINADSILPQFEYEENEVVSCSFMISDLMIFFL